jgi:hypothetical protein
VHGPDGSPQAADQLDFLRSRPTFLKNLPKTHASIAISKNAAAPSTSKETEQGYCPPQIIKSKYRKPFSPLLYKHFITLTDLTEWIYAVQLRISF